MKTNNIKKATVVLLALALVTCFAISGTLAKYTTSFAASDSARVARFSVDADTSTIDLFDTVREANTVDAENDVWNNTTDGKKVIAPGTGGSFALEIDDESEVTVAYSIKFAVTANSIPLEFSTNGTTWVAAADIDDLEVSGVRGDTDKGTGLSVGTVYWRWALTDTTNAAATEARDTADTTLGTATTLAEATVTATATFTQVD